MNIEKKKKPEKITVDTNILISGFVYTGRSVEVMLDRMMNGDVRLGISEELLREFSRVCIVKMNYDPLKTMKMIMAIKENFEMVEPAGRVHFLKDEPDNGVLECAEGFGADCIITGDKAFLALKEYKGIEILSPADYVREYGGDINVIKEDTTVYGNYKGHGKKKRSDYRKFAKKMGIKPRTRTARP